MIFSEARALVQGAIASRAFPAAVIDVGRSTGPIWQAPFGQLTYEPASPAAALDTIFDLASLTKVIATTSIAMREIDAGRLSIDTRVGDVFPGWAAGERGEICVRHLLDHSSGLPAHARLWTTAADRAAYARAFLDLPLEHAPGAAAVYSDIGFMLLGFLVEDIGGAALDAAFGALDVELGTGCVFNPPAAWRDRVAPTERDPWRGRVLVGDVHDENAAALGGVAGHAGLFGTAPGVGAFARVVLETFRRETPLGSPVLMRQFATPTGVPGSSRALGWDTMRPTSSCGARLSPTAIGHTGFTGTSLWIDWERDVYVAVLTNRVHPTRENAALAALRPRLHDAIVAGL